MPWSDKGVPVERPLKLRDRPVVLPHVMRRTTIGLIVAVTFLVTTCSNDSAQLTTDLATRPSDAAVVYDDLGNFWQAFSALAGRSDSAAVIQSMYLDQATPGLVEYIDRYELTAERLLEAIRRDPRAHMRLRNEARRLAAQEHALREAFADLQRLIPTVVFPPTYYVIGDQRVSANSEVGLLVSAGTRRAPQEHAQLVTHELVHFQQAMAQGLETYRAIYGPRKSLLAISVREGAAEFLVRLALGGHQQRSEYDYYVEHEAELWERFRAQMLGTETGEWMWVRPADPAQPWNLGYVIGMRIVEAYYEQAGDKAQAIRDILGTTDFVGFLEQSGYPGIL